MSAKGDDLVKEMRSEAVKLFEVAVKRVDPYEAVRNFVRLRQGTLILGHRDQAKIELELGSYDRIFIVGGGKATAPMAMAIEHIIGKRIDRGVINVKYGFTEELSFTQIIEASHPVPNQRGVEGTARIMELLKEAGENDLVFSLISGGGSALMPYPANGISLEDKQAVTTKLLECGASIDEINAIRKHISRSKGGQMARAAFPATTVNLMLSDVVGDRMDVIASGPFVPDTSSFQDARAVLRKYGLSDIPDSVKRYLQDGVEGKVPETPAQGDPIFERVYNFVVGSNIIALEAAREAAETMGYQCLILSSMVEGETREVAKVHTAIAKEILKSGRPIGPPACIISGGETTVVIHGRGLGGRNQEFCLACALELEDLPGRVVILSGGTDGNDGPTDAAGAVVDPFTVGRGKSLGLDAASFLQENDSYHFFEKTRDLLVTGPTRTNVMDVRFVLVR